MSAPSFFTYHAGDVKVHVVSDGQVVVPLSEGFVQNASTAVVREALAEAGQPTEMLTTTFAPLVLETAGRQVVVDVGLGPDTADQPGSTRGLFTRNMRAGGIDPENIRTVVISHFHPDHVNGLVSNGTPVFRNAEVAVPGVEWRSGWTIEKWRALPRAMFWDLMNDVRGEPYMPKFEVWPYLKMRH